MHPKEPSLLDRTAEAGGDGTEVPFTGPQPAVSNLIYAFFSDREPQQNKCRLLFGELGSIKLATNPPLPCWA